MVLPYSKSPPILASSSSLTLEDLEKLEAAHTSTLRRAEQESRQSHICLRSLLSERDTLAAQRLELQDQLCSSHNELKTEVERRRKDIARLQAETDHWRVAHRALQEENDSLRTAYDKDKERWNRFKQWWDGKVQERQSKLGKKSKLSEQDRVILQELDLTESPAKAAATVSEAAPLPSPLAVSSEPAREACYPHKPPAPSVAAPSLATPTMGTATRLPRADTADTSQRVQNWLQMVDARSTMLGNLDKAEAAVGKARLRVDYAAGPNDCVGGQEVGPIPSAGGQSQLKRRRITLPANPSESVIRRRPLGPSTSSEMILQRKKRTRSTTPPERAATTREVKPTVKVESDDDTQRVVAKKRLATAHDENGLHVESREDAIQRRRKEDMEDLRKNPWKYRGHGRYADELRRKNALTTEYELIPELNGGATYEHVDVIRDRRTRRQMHAHGCPCCKDYWELVGPSAETPVEGGKVSAGQGVHATFATASLAANATVPSFRRNDTGPVRTLLADAGFQERQAERARLIALDEEEREQTRLADERRQRAGKHRAWGQPPPTPEGYWDIGFPDTPRKKAINDSAQKQTAEKEWQVQRDKRYRKRRVNEDDQQP